MNTANTSLIILSEGPQSRLVINMTSTAKKHLFLELNGSLPTANESSSIVVVGEIRPYK